MTIERDKVLELAVHVKLASEAIVTAATELQGLRPGCVAGGEAAAWVRTMDELIAMNVELGFMERILRSALRGPSEAVQPRMRQ
jgi:hypothetical protein